MAVLGRLRELLHNQAERVRQRPFLEAMMAASALIATADGKVSFSERIRLDELIESLKELEVFDPHEAVDLFNDFADALLDSPAEGRTKALHTIERIADDEAAAQLMMRVCAALSRADGQLSPGEREVTESIGRALGIDPASLQ